MRQGFRPPLIPAVSRLQCWGPCDESTNARRPVLHREYSPRAGRGARPFTDSTVAAAQAGSCLPIPPGWSWGAEHLVILGQAPFLSAPALNAGNSAWAKEHEGLGLQGSLERRARGTRGSTRAWGSGRGWRPLSRLSAACCRGTPPQSPLAWIKQGYIRNTSACRTGWVSVHFPNIPLTPELEITLSASFPPGGSEDRTG